MAVQVCDFTGRTNILALLGSEREIASRYVRGRMSFDMVQMRPVVCENVESFTLRLGTACVVAIVCGEDPKGIMYDFLQFEMHVRRICREGILPFPQMSDQSNVTDWRNVLAAVAKLSGMIRDTTPYLCNESGTLSPAMSPFLHICRVNSKKQGHILCTGSLEALHASDPCMTSCRELILKTSRP